MHHTVELAPAVEELLRRTGVKPEEIRAVGVAQGPGSYTALRIGMAFAAGFAIPHNLPVYGIPTFEILVRAQPVTEKDLVAVLRAGRGRIAWCAYKAVGREMEGGGRGAGLHLGSAGRRCAETGAGVRGDRSRRESGAGQTPGSETRSSAPQRAAGGGPRGNDRRTLARPGNAADDAPADLPGFDSKNKGGRVVLIVIPACSYLRAGIGGYGSVCRKWMPLSTPARHARVYSQELFSLPHPAFGHLLPANAGRREERTSFSRR